MLMLDNIIRLETNDNYKQLVLEAKYLVEQHFTFSLNVISGEFSGKGTFCLSIDEIKRLIADLNEINKSIEGTTLIQDYDSDSFLKFRVLDPYGHLEISGQVGCSINDHFMTFKFITDQTVIKPLIVEFQEIIKISA